MRRIIFCFLVVCLASCAPFQPLVKTSSGTLIEGVPFYPDDRYLCGPASLAAVMNYHGAGESLNQIADKIYSENARGTLPVDLKWYAEEKGFVTEKVDRLKTLQSKIDKNLPTVVFIEDRGFLRNYPHFMVVVGYNSEGLVVNTGNYEHRLVKYNRFTKLWENTGNWGMTVHKN